MSDYAEYNRLLAEAKIKALEVLRGLLRTCEDPVEARRIADAILKATTSKPRKRAATPAVPERQQQAQQPAKPAGRVLTPHALGTLYLDAHALTIEGADTCPVTNLTPERIITLPIHLTPSGEPQYGGGPGSQRPLPPPLGPPRA